MFHIIGKHLTYATVGIAVICSVLLDIFKKSDGQELQIKKYNNVFNLNLMYSDVSTKMCHR